MDFIKNIYTLIRNALSLDNAVIIKEDDNYLFVDDKEAAIFYIVVKQVDKTLDSLIANAINYEPTVSVISEVKLDISANNAFKCFRETYQYSYTGKPFVLDVPYQISELTLNDYDYLKSHYYRNGDDESYLKECIRRGMLKAHYGKIIIGFVGEHPEHALGLLFVDENYRRQGIGGSLEKAMINKTLGEGRVPIEHVVITNESSKKLQASIPDMEKDDGYVYWYF
ncbi:MAG: GNAT family N-acetyltransferase [Bacilli bacterium]|nr:GNAT family N-acetyltransferase [Bacilli bacterium]